MEKAKLTTFLDGLCSIWNLDENQTPVLVLKNVRFSRRIVGARRSYDAEQAGHTIEMVIRIPRADFVAAGGFVTIGARQYQISKAQPIFDTLPQSSELTLENPQLLYDFDQNEVGAGGRV